MPGVMFVVMGGGPLLFVLAALRGGASSRFTGAERLTRGSVRPAESPWTAATVGLRSEPSGPTPDEPAPRDDAAPRDLVGELERLSALHGVGALDDAEFAAAKRRLLGEDAAR